ncbi:hypothetical protein BD626DRAFT_241500 [Schizophyllum amplum]|uniref:Uncharacterized protein n=1 Tax=Schizophyllum amplum TaxID=97359 RepID=A0A550BVY2_9AGAR|nr:hypothetical protein BD626DRAFT_241500 [Auriculariopsis ampla]
MGIFSSPPSTVLCVFLLYLCSLQLAGSLALCHAAPLGGEFDCDRSDPSAVTGADPCRLVPQVEGWVGNERQTVEGEAMDEPRTAHAAEDEQEDAPGEGEGGGDSGGEQDPDPTDDLVQPNSRPTRRGIAGIIILVITLLSTISIASYAPARRRTATYTRVAWSHVRTTCSHASTYIPYVNTVGAACRKAAFTVVLLPARLGMVPPRFRASEDKLVRWAEEDLGLDSLEADHFLNEDDEVPGEWIDDEYIPLRAARGKTKAYGSVGKGAGKVWF